MIVCQNSDSLDLKFHNCIVIFLLVLQFCSFQKSLYKCLHHFTETTFASALICFWNRVLNAPPLKNNTIHINDVLPPQVNRRDDSSHQILHRTCYLLHLVAFLRGHGLQFPDMFSTYRYSIDHFNSYYLYKCMLITSALATFTLTHTFTSLLKFTIRLSLHF